MTLAPKKISALSVADPASSSDYIPIVQGGSTKKMAARKAVNPQTTPYKAVLADTDGYIRLGDGASNNTQVHFTIPKNADAAIPILGTLTIECLSSGGMIVVGDADVTVNPTAVNGLAVLTKNGIAVATKVGTDEWTVAGVAAI